MRLSIAAAAACLSIVGVAAANHAAAAIKKFTDIPAQELGSALQTLAQDRDFQVVYLSDAVDKVKTSGAVGEFTADEALKKLLKGTGLSYRYLDEKTITVLPTRGGSATSSKDSAGVRVKAEGDGAAAVYGAGESGDSEGGKDKSLWDRFRVAQVATNSSSPSPGTGEDARSADENKNTISEIIVTAQKKGAERLQDVPVPVTVLKAEDLLAQNQLRIQDYFSEVPGLNMITSSGLGTQTLVVRGIGSGVGSSATVGVVVDDIPFGGSWGSTGDFLLPDIDPNDLARVEVLRGPQGTLYGAESMGGLLKFVTIDPSTDVFGGRVQGGMSTIYNGANPGYNMRASVNIPVNGTLAIRASGFARLEPGYIDNPVQGRDGVNEKKFSGGRLAVLWRPSDDISLRISAFYQQQVADAYDDENPALGYLKAGNIRNTDDNDRRFLGVSSILTAKFGDMTLTSLTGYNSAKIKDSYDYTYAFGGVGGISETAYGVLGAPFPESDANYKINQELRLSGSLGDNLDWLVAGYFDHDHSLSSSGVYAEDTGTGAIVGDIESFINPFSYREYAGFANLTYRFTDRFNVQIGARESDIKLTGEPSSFVAPAYGVPTPVMGARVDSDKHAFTYLVTPEFKISPDLMTYIRLASGFRPGAVNPPSGGVFPPQNKPDTTRNYELGVKGDFLQHSLSVDASIYYIDWRDIQVFFFDQVTNVGGYFTNGSHAKSQGAELSLEWRPAPQSTIAGWVSFDDAVLTQPLPPSGGLAYGVSGTRLPFSSRFSGNVSFKQNFSLWSGANGFVGGSVSWVGDKLGQYASTATSPRQDYPGYAQVNLVAGVARNDWTLNLYANNVTNRHALLGGGTGQYPPTLLYIQPRTIGFNLAEKF